MTRDLQLIWSDVGHRSPAGSHFQYPESPAAVPGGSCQQLLPELFALERAHGGFVQKLSETRT